MTISRAVANNPDVLLLDEPTGGILVYFECVYFVLNNCHFEPDLDTKNSNIIMDLLLKLNREENITCVFVTHDVSLKYFAHRVIHMLDGKISKIEIISKKRRLNAERELREAIRNQNNPLYEERNSPQNRKEIEVREPNEFYPYLAFKQKYDKKQKILKEKRKRKRMLRRKMLKESGNYDEDEDEDEFEEDEDISDNEIVGDEFDDEDDIKEDDDDIEEMNGDGHNMNMNGDHDEIGLESAETRKDRENNSKDSGNDNIVEEEVEDGVEE